ncbi:hypothetical protein [Algiphilus aromaticivorans]|jgi:hypothetical protein|uniref:hypothetical protein n=1 Tax=Algiphilus aromaticivorans TaxID=382454 RepID=UPI0005C1D676|nr:hypothetical protein [Algiphilus aromaticivorans]
MNIPIHARLGAVFTVSILSVWLLPAAEWVKGMLAVPGVGALVGALLQISRDAAAFERQKYLQRDQQIFTLGAGSHMSTVAFDKHVAFCEAYMKEVHETIGTLFREGPTDKGMHCAQKLFELKRDYAAWVTKAMALKLEPFENAIHQIGVQTHLVNALRGEDQQARSKAIDESYALFRNILGLGKMKETDPDHKQELAIENVKEQVRAILGINELVDIRTFIIQRSAAYARENA